jgi:GAF domain-containing protein
MQPIYIFSVLLLVVSVSAVAIYQRRPSPRDTEKQLQHQKRILQAIASNSTLLLQSPRWQDVMDTVLAQLGQAAEASRVYLFEKHVHPTSKALLVSQRHSWVAEGIAPTIDDPRLQNIPFGESFPRWVAHFEQGQLVSGVVRTFPASERAFLDPQDILSLAVIPIMVEGEWWGLIGLDECVGERVWTQAEIEMLQIAANHVGAAIERQRQTVQISKTADMLARAQTIGQMGYWEWDLLTDEVTWSDEMYRLFGLPIDKTQIHPRPIPRCSASRRCHAVS